MTGFKPGDRVWQKQMLREGTVIKTYAACDATLVRVQLDGLPGPSTTDAGNLEQLGEPMTAFDSPYDDTVSLRIEPRIGQPGIYMELRENGNKSTAIFPPEQAAAHALATLEAAGTEDDEVPVEMANAVRNLRRLVTRQMEAAAKAAAERTAMEALEGEALELCRVFWGNPDQAWAPMSGQAKETWLGLARRARELHGVTA